MMTGEPEKALAAFDRIVALDPLNYSFRRAYADIQATMGRHDDALKFYNECQENLCLREGFIVFGSNNLVITHMR